jgi:hypothetical protein
VDEVRRRANLAADLLAGTAGAGDVAGSSDG